MANRSRKKRRRPSDASDFRFHLLENKPGFDAANPVIGAFVTGPASILLSGILSAPQSSASVKPQKTSGHSKSRKSAAEAAESKSKVRGRKKPRKHGEP